MFRNELLRPFTNRRSIAIFALSLSALGLALGPGAGSAGAVTNGSIGIVGSTLTYTAQNSKANDLEITLVGTDVVVHDAGVAALDDSDGAGGCTVVAATATCPAAAIADAALDTEDGADAIAIDAALSFPARIIAGPGRDTIQGGSGDDILDGALGDDTIVGGAGIDTVDYSARIQPVQVNLDGIANDGQSGEDDNIGDDVENVIGGRKDDVLTGDDSDNILAGGPGADVLAGGGGNDTVSYAGRSAAVTVDLDGVADDGEVGEGDTVGDDIEGITGGGGDDTLTGGSSDGAIDGGPGNDTLDGGAGADELSGGPGTDLLSYASRTTPVSVIPDGEANDGQVDSNGDSTEDDNVAGDIEQVHGGSGNDVLESGPGSGTIDGGPGNDTASYSQRSEPVSLSLNGASDDGQLGENDTLTGIEKLAGGDGNDTLTGDGAANALSGGAGDDTLDGSGGADQLNGGDGTDTADYSARAAPINADADGHPDDGVQGEFDNVATDVESARGGSGDDRLAGNDGDGTLDGGPGNDIFPADLGDDLVKGGAGIDTVDYSARGAGVTVTLDDNPDDGEVAGEDDNIGSDVEVAIGGPGDDLLTGSDGPNSLIGGSGDDTIDGAAGDDTLNAGYGDDNLDGGPGADVLQAGSGDDSLSGEDGPDQLVGDVGVDSFDGGDGNDAIASRDGAREDVACGDGSDAADADAFDNVDDDCEGLTGFIAGAAVNISSRALKMSRDGTVTVHVVCIRDPKDCEGDLTITALKSKHLGKKAIGKDEFSVSSGDSDDIEITLTKAARRAVLTGKRLPVRIKTEVPRTPAVSRTTKIVAPKKTSKAKKR
jgi:Ca2+-binding RTX toxin-like protein